MEKDVKVEVKLISYSQPGAEFQSNLGVMNLQDLVAYSARVSNPSNQMNKETNEKLIHYLLNHAHWSPLEMVSVCLEISTTRDIARQVLRHRSFSFQEFCVSGDTEIYFAVPAKLSKGAYAPTYKMKIKDLYDKWVNGAAPITRSHGTATIRMPLKDRLQNMMLKCYDAESKTLTTTHIKEVFSTGVKPLFEITLSDGKKIKTTKEHKFFTTNGFSTLEDIVGLVMEHGKALMTIPKPIIGVNGIPSYQNKEWLQNAKNKVKNSYSIKWQTIEKIEYVGEEPTYDIEVEHPDHNYIANGIVTHNSQRYADPTSDLGFEIREARLQDLKNRQNSYETDNGSLVIMWEEKQQELIDKVKQTYNWAIDNGIAKEQARSILPEGNTVSRMYMNGTLRSWVHYITLRTGKETQKEHREVAQACANAIETVFPMIKEFVK